jgi:hypothetical protein
MAQQQDAVLTLFIVLRYSGQRSNCRCPIILHARATTRFRRSTLWQCFRSRSAGETHRCVVSLPHQFRRGGLGSHRPASHATTYDIHSRNILLAAAVWWADKAPAGALGALRAAAWSSLAAAGSPCLVRRCAPMRARRLRDYRAVSLRSGCASRTPNHPACRGQRVHVDCASTNYLMQCRRVVFERMRYDKHVACSAGGSTAIISNCVPGFRGNSVFLLV